MRIKKIATAAFASLSVFALSACATGFPAQVQRYQAMPSTEGQSFVVVPASQDLVGTLEFQRYGELVAQAMAAQGYAPAASMDQATMVVKVDYGVDGGTERLVRDPFARSMYADPFFNGAYDPFYGGYFGRPYYSRFGYWGRRTPYYYGWQDPFWYAPYGGMYQTVRQYTEYKSYLDIDIRRKVDDYQLFDGEAKARSTSDNLGVLVPNLVEAMFTGFPGRNGETVKITVPPSKD